MGPSSEDRPGGRRGSRPDGPPSTDHRPPPWAAESPPWRQPDPDPDAPAGSRPRPFEAPDGAGPRRFVRRLEPGRPSDRGGTYRSGPDRRPAPPARQPFRRPETEPRPAWASAVGSAEVLDADEELVAGRRPVEEAFAARRPAVRLLVTPQRRLALERIVLHATTLRIPIVEVEGGTLTALAGFDGHQGVALVVEPRRFAGLDDILARAIERGEPAFVLVLDSLEDPQNLGTVLRSAEAAGIHGVIFPTARQAPLSPAAVKASAGATEHLLLCPVDDLAAALSDLHVRGLRIVGSEAEAALSVRQADLRGPIAIVIGSEGHGLAPAVRRRCDLMVRIPMRGAIGSFNAAVAGSVLLFEALGQRDPDARPAAAAPVSVAAPTTTATPGPATAPKPAPKARPRRPPAPPPIDPDGIAAAPEADEPSAAAKRRTAGRSSTAIEQPAKPRTKRARKSTKAEAAAPGSEGPGSEVPAAAEPGPDDLLPAGGNPSA